MPEFVEPKTYLIGYTTLDRIGLGCYLTDTDNIQFREMIDEAENRGLSAGEILCSFYAKLCYASLTLGKNQNVKKVREIEDNILATLDAAHGSVFEHCQLNFVTTNCSRILTHELVRHRAGTAFSQTSGRYVRSDVLRFITDPILEEYGVLHHDEQTTILEDLEEIMSRCNDRINALDLPFHIKKQLTSACRRFYPNGQANEIGWSCNLRSVRHMVQMRTSIHAEFEIRSVFGQVYGILKNRYPLMFSDAKTRMVDGLVEVYGMRMQPYESKE